MRINTKKVAKFQHEYPEYWHEGLDEKFVKEIKDVVKSKYNFLVRKFYWQKGKSYILDDILSGHKFCISKEYYDQL